MDSSVKPRVNGEQLGNYKGQVVCALGKLKENSFDGSCFRMFLSDGVEIEVFLQNKPDKDLEGMIEVIGEVGGNARQIQAHIHRSLGDVDFDMNLYNEAVTLAQQFPDFYKVGAPGSESQSMDSMNA